MLKFEVSPLQLAEWLIHGIAVIISLLQVDSVNDRTRWPIPRATINLGTERQHSRACRKFFSRDFVADFMSSLPGLTLQERAHSGLWS